MSYKTHPETYDLPLAPPLSHDASLSTHPSFVLSLALSLSLSLFELVEDAFERFRTNTFAATGTHAAIPEFG